MTIKVRCVTYKISGRQEEILKFIQEKVEVSQPDILIHFLDSYANKIQARQNLCVLLRKLREQEYVVLVRTEKNEMSGGIYRNILALTNKGEDYCNGKKTT